MTKKTYAWRPIKSRRNLEDSPGMILIKCISEASLETTYGRVTVLKRRYAKIYFTAWIALQPRITKAKYFAEEIMLLGL